jgi:hypothetical protein
MDVANKLGIYTWLLCTKEIEKKKKCIDRFKLYLIEFSQHNEADFEMQYYFQPYGCSQQIRLYLYTLSIELNQIKCPRYLFNLATISSRQLNSTPTQPTQKPVNIFISYVSI